MVVSISLPLAQNFLRAKHLLSNIHLKMGHRKCKRATVGLLVGLIVALMLFAFLCLTKTRPFMESLKDLSIANISKNDVKKPNQAPSKVKRDAEESMEPVAEPLLGLGLSDIIAGIAKLKEYKAKATTSTTQATPRAKRSPTEDLSVPEYLRRQNEHISKLKEAIKRVPPQSRVVTPSDEATVTVNF